MNQDSPLADRIRPTKLADFIGQSHLVGKNKPIRRLVETGQIHSMIFWGPPGCGKTTLARLIAKAISADFIELSAVSAGKAELKKAVDQARTSKKDIQQKLDSLDSPIRINSKKNSHNSVILFVDEIHRFNKAQQDFLLPYVEDGTLILIGATTENPSFEVISPLLSRSQVFVLESISVKDLQKIIQAGAKQLKVALSDEALDFLSQFANGDARQALTLLENASRLYASKRKTREITKTDLKETLQSKHLRFDKGGEEHYNTISAFIKSMRASDPNAALYYLARMVQAGEDPKFIARRMVVFASEDVGMAQPTALVVANEVFRSVETIGYPECAINLAHGVVYLAAAKKDRRAYDGLRAAQADVKQFGNLEIPLELRNAPTKLMKDLGYGSGYEKYPKDKNLLPAKLKGTKYYR